MTSAMKLAVEPFLMSAAAAAPGGGSADDLFHAVRSLEYDPLEHGGPGPLWQASARTRSAARRGAVEIVEREDAAADGRRRRGSADRSRGAIAVVAVLTSGMIVERIVPQHRLVEHDGDRRRRWR